MTIDLRCMACRTTGRIKRWDGTEVECSACDGRGRHLPFTDVLNPPPEPEMTFEEWYAEFLRLLSDSMPISDTERLEAHARKRIRP